MEELERAGLSQALFPGAKAPAWLWRFPQQLEGRSPPPKLRNAQNGCLLTALQAPMTQAGVPTFRKMPKRRPGQGEIPMATSGAF